MKAVGRTKPIIAAKETYRPRILVWFWLKTGGGFGEELVEGKANFERISMYKMEKRMNDKSEMLTMLVTERRVAIISIVTCREFRIAILCSVRFSVLIKI